MPPAIRFFLRISVANPFQLRSLANTTSVLSELHQLLPLRFILAGVHFAVPTCLVLELRSRLSYSFGSPARMLYVLIPGDAPTRKITRSQTCDDFFENGATTAPLSDGNMACKGNTKETCGAWNQLNLFTSRKAPLPPPTIPAKIGSYPPSLFQSFYPRVPGVFAFCLPNILPPLSAAVYNKTPVSGSKKQAHS